MDPLEAVTEAVALHAGWLEDARRKGDAGPTVQRWTRRMWALQQAADILRALGDAASTGEDASDLPPALLAQLSGPTTDVLEDKILEILRTEGGDAGLDRLLIQLYRRHGELHERKALNNKAYRMVRKGLIRQADDKRGVYRLPPRQTGSADTT